MVDFIIYTLILIPILFKLHIVFQENTRIGIRSRVRDFYITNQYNEDAKYIDIILDYCNYSGQHPKKVFKHFPEKFLEKKPVYEPLF